MAAQFCPGCGRPVKPLTGADSNLAPRTDQPLTASVGTETLADVAEVARFLPQRYKPIKKIGQGGMGTVYQCLDQALDRLVAIKCMTDRYRADPQGERRFLREARAQAIVNHPNIATILNFGITQEGHPFLVMEFLEGKDLRSIIRTEKIIEPLRACDLLRQICEGLAEAHSSGLVHRDLKPSNVIICRDHRGGDWVKVLDLGLAKIIGGQTDLKSISMDTANLLVGTPAYMSPEQVAGAPVDGRADLYSVGVVFFEMLTGRLPFESETMEGWLYQHLHAAPPVPSHINRDLAKTFVLDRLALWLMAKQPHERPQSAADVAQMAARLIERRLADDAVPRPARKSGPRAALSFEDNPPARKSGPRVAVTYVDGPEPPPDSPAAHVLEVPPAVPVRHPTESAIEQRRQQYLNLVKAAEAAESQRAWTDALDLWQRALPIADRAETVQARIQGCRREIEFEEQLNAANKAATTGNWDLAEKTLLRLSSQRQGDTRVEQARARLPKKLIASWLGLARNEIMPLPEGDLRQALMERLGLAFAQAGDMPHAKEILQDTSRKAQSRVVGLAQAVVAAIQNDVNEGLRPYLDESCEAAESLTDPSERGRALLEVGRALTAYGDRGAAAKMLQGAITAFGEANTKGIPMQPTSRRTTAMLFRRTSADLRSFTGTTTSFSGTKAIRASFEAALGTVAQAQAEASLVNDALNTTALIDDAWTLSHTLSQVAQAFARTGHTADAEKLCIKITFALPKTQALRALAVSKVYSGDLPAAEEILRGVSAPPDRIALLGLLATACALRSEQGRSEVRVADALKTIADVVGAKARFQALLSAAEPLLNAGFQDLAAPLVADAGKLIDLLDDPAERLRSLLQMALAEENARVATLAATRTIVVTHQPSTIFVDLLRRALMISLQVRYAPDRLDCIERLAHNISWGSAAELATEILNTCRDDSETAVANIGLSTGMI
ncbi:MAG TPA: serine/threonine-protein kinase [Planctomycetota bacterium]